MIKMKKENESFRIGKMIGNRIDRIGNRIGNRFSKRIDKRGIFFTLIAISLLTIIVYSFAIFTYSLTDRSLVIQTRIETMDSFMNDVESDLERGLYISTFRSVLGMEQYVIDNGTFIADAEDQFQEVFFNGTINNNYMIITQDNLFDDWIFKIWEKGHAIGIDVNITVDSVSLYQDEPWYVEATLDANIIIKDSKGTSSWTKSSTYNTRIPITGLEDVLYTYNLEMKASNIIQQSPYEGNYVINGDITNLQNHLDGSDTFLVGSYYTASTNGPGFLDRLEGRTTIFRAGTGIESFLNKQKLIDILGATEASQYYLEGRSSIDHVQFANSNPTNYSITNMPFWFRLDNTTSNLEKYNVSSIANEGP